MWNENAPLELLKELPAVLNDANLSRVQSVIDYDKFINSSEYGYDLCGTYAPFCAGCEKNGNSPCAVAYVKMKQSQGFNVAIEKQVAEAVTTPVEQVEAAPVEVEVAVKDPVAPVEEAPVKAPAKRRVRVAVAKRKTN
jgi:hypothetical protein